MITMKAETLKIKHEIKWGSYLINLIFQSSMQKYVSDTDWLICIMVLPKNGVFFLFLCTFNFFFLAHYF